MKRFIALVTIHGLRNLLLIASALLGAVFAVVVYASVPGADGLIHGCYQANNGQLRVVDADTGTGCRWQRLQSRGRRSMSLMALL